MRVGMVSIWLLSVILFLPAILPGQKESQQPKFDVQVNLVSLDVEVLDRDGGHVWGLTRSDFAVEENGRPMEISNFAISMDRPVSLAAVLDTSALSVEQLVICKAFLRTISHDLERSDEICLYSFDERDAYLEQDFTSKMSSVWGALDNIGVPSRQKGGVLKELFGRIPPTGLAIDLGLKKLESARNGKKALILISNRFRGMGPATVEHIQRSGCLLLTLAFPHKASIWAELGGDAISTNQYMRESGGRQFSAVSPDIEKVCREIIYSMKNYYSIGYLTEVRSGDKNPRKIRVRLPKYRYTVNSRRTYIPTVEAK